MTSLQEMAVPVKVQYPLFLKILTFDRELPRHTGEEIVIGVVYQARVRASWLAKDEFMRVIDASSLRSVKDLPVRAVPVEFNEPEDLARAVEEQGVNVFYVGPLRAVEMRNVTAISRARKIRTLTGVPDYVEDGLAVGIGLREQRPELLINLDAARAEGAHFNARLLKLARVIGKGG